MKKCTLALVWSLVRLQVLCCCCSPSDHKVATAPQYQLVSRNNYTLPTIQLDLLDLSMNIAQVTLHTAANLELVCFSECACISQDTWIRLWHSKGKNRISGLSTNVPQNPLRCSKFSTDTPNNPGNTNIKLSWLCHERKSTGITDTLSQSCPKQVSEVMFLTSSHSPLIWPS